MAHPQLQSVVVVQGEKEDLLMVKGAKKEKNN